MFPRAGSQARFPKVWRKRIPNIPSSQARFPRFSGRGSQARLPSKLPRSIRTDSARFRKIPKNRFPTKVSNQGFQPGKVPKQVSQARFPPGRGPQVRFPSKVLKSRFPSKVPKQGFPSKAPRNSFASKVSRHRCPNKHIVVPDRWSIKCFSRLISSSFQAFSNHDSNKHVLTFSCSCCCWGYPLGLF